MSKHIVNHPGGVILHHADGVSEYYGYGAEVDPEKLADYQQETLGNYTDSKDRSGYARGAAVEAAAHRNAALADSGQINSTSDPVPGNYGELSEEDAAQLLLAMSADPQIQARLLLHERLHGGSRQMVIDSGSPAATAIAEVLFSQIEDGLDTTFNQTPVIDRERQVEREARQQESQHSRRSGGGRARSSGGGRTPSPNS